MFSEAWFWHVLETVGQDIPLLNQTSLLLHQTVFQTSSNRNIYILQVRMGRLRRTREFTARCGLFPNRTEHFSWLGLNGYQIVNKLRSSVASCMFQTCKHITPWYDQSLYPYPNTCQNHASENTFFLRARGCTAIGVSETEKT